MKVELNQLTCTVQREQGDPKLRDGSWGDAESLLLYRVKKALNAQGYDLIKKRMWRDGHLVDENQLYLRDRKWRFAIYDLSWAIRNSATTYNDGEVVSFRAKRWEDA
jgi:hypothetical protein